MKFKDVVKKFARAGYAVKDTAVVAKLGLVSGGIRAQEWASEKIGEVSEGFREVKSEREESEVVLSQIRDHKEVLIHEEEDDELREAQNYLSSEPLPVHLEKHVEKVPDGYWIPDRE